MQKRSKCVAVTACLVGIGCVVNSSAGPLDPPPGPVAATGPTMILAVPFTISSPGSYRLARSFQLPPNTTAITIASADVTLDLGGFTLAGQGIQLTPAILLSMPLPVFPNTRVTIRNGVIRNFPGPSINGVGVPGVTVENMTDFTNLNGSAGGGGIQLGATCSLRNCTLSYGGTTNLGDNARVSGCEVHGNETVGMTVGKSSIVENSIFHDNGPTSQTTQLGVGDGSLVVNCTARNGKGIVLGNRATARGCVIEPAGVGGGIVGADGCTVDSCSVGGASDGPMIALGNASVIRSTKVTAGLNGGISVGSASVIEGCVIQTTGVGVAAGGDCVIAGNRITNASTAISLSGSGSRVIQNSIRNATTAIANPGGNDVGPIGTAASSTSPWANLIN